MNNLPSEEAKQAVSDALSEYVQGLGYNIAIDVQPYSLVDYTTDMNMRLAGGEELDIIYTGPINTAVTNGYLVNLDEYRDEGNEKTEEAHCTAFLLTRVSPWITSTFITKNISRTLT